MNCHRPAGIFALTAMLAFWTIVILAWTGILK